MRKQSALLLLVLILSVYAYSQPTFERSYGARGYSENQDDVKKIDQSHFLITGSTNLNGENDFDAYCIAVDEKGHALWSKTYGTSYSNGSTKCWGTADSGFLICFTSYDGPYIYGDSISGIFVVKCDREGRVQWAKCMKSAVPPKKPVSITPAYIYESKEGDVYVLCDWHGSTPDFSLTKLSSNGSLLWSTSVAQDTYFPYQYQSVQIAEAGDGDIIVAENAYGDNFYSFGNYIHLLSFSQASGNIRKSRHLVATDGNREALLSSNNVVAGKDKVSITASYRQGLTTGICWFTLKLNDNKVKATYIPYTNQLSYQYLISRQLIQQLEEGFDSRTFYTKGGGYFFAYTGGSPDYNIILDRYDSLGRICPKFIAQTPINTTQYETTVDATYQPYFVVRNTLVALDTTVTVTNVISEKTVCEGSAVNPLAETNRSINTLSSQLNTTGTKLYPNPSADAVTIVYETDRAAKIEIDIITSEGKRVITKEVFAGKGRQQTTLPVQRLLPGIYFIKVNGLAKPETLSFLKQ